MARKSTADTDRTTAIRVLMVEDMEFEAELASHHLRGERIPHVVHRVETEQAMRSALQEFKPTIILSDFTLPQFDGMRALEVARECAPEVPFVFVSGTIGEERAIEALHRGAIDYVLKTNLARLGPAVRRALEEAQARAVQHRQERQIHRLTSVLRMLSGINGAVVRIRGRADLLREACRLAVAIGGYPMAFVALHRQEEQRLEPVAFDGADLATVNARCRLIEAALDGQARSENPGRDVAAPFECRDPQTGQPAALALPLLVDNTPIGVLALCCRDLSGIGGEEARMLREVAANLSFALQYLDQGSKVRLLSYFDVLTGLAKRPLFCQRLRRLLLQDPGNVRSRCAIAILDVKNLNAINDSFGRHAGDLLLQLVADRLRQRDRDTGMLAHFSGGTFAVVVPIETVGEVSLEKLSAQLDSLFEEPFSLAGQDIPVAARIGIAVHPDEGRDPDTLVQRAEASLHNAKIRGQRRGQYSPQQHSEALARVVLERKLRQALEQRQFELYYQPKVSVTHRHIEGAEALIRWNDPERGLVAPAEFLPLLEECGLIVDVGEWVIEQAALDCQRWRLLGLPPIRVAVNISPVQLREPDFVQRFLNCTRSWSTETCGLDVEITEGVLGGDASGEIGKLKALRSAGVKIAIDDFGTGYSSLSRLAHLPIDTLKIDRSFIGEMTADGRSRRLVSIIVSIARTFDMVTVAEGVETQEQLDMLWHLGCEQSQGYLHSRPLSIEHFNTLLERCASRGFLSPDSAQAPAA
jgi:diguanylate cyclase (GGDEF)-like protein